MKSEGSMPGVLRVDSMGRNLKGSSRIEAFEGHERLWMQRKLQMCLLWHMSAVPDVLCKQFSQKCSQESQEAVTLNYVFPKKDTGAWKIT